MRNPHTLCKDDSKIVVPVVPVVPTPQKLSDANGFAQDDSRNHRSGWSGSSGSGELTLIRQSRTMSMVEAVANVVVGYGLAVLTQIVVFPIFDVAIPFADNLLIGGVFSVVSIVRSYLLRRLFERRR